ncbi:MAG: hypothetical protein IPJ82_04210 [Lewinellaceae bacterium]|nr:hypothetical protein [Lewinellaceae bacterium]
MGNAVKPEDLDRFLSALQYLYKSIFESENYPGFLRSAAMLQSAHSKELVARLYPEMYSRWVKTMKELDHQIMFLIGGNVIGKENNYWEYLKENPAFRNEIEELNQYFHERRDNAGALLEKLMQQNKLPVAFRLIFTIAVLFLAALLLTSVYRIAWYWGYEKKLSPPQTLVFPQLQNASINFAYTDVRNGQGELVCGIVALPAVLEDSLVNLKVRVANSRDYFLNFEQNSLEIKKDGNRLGIFPFRFILSEYLPDSILLRFTLQTRSKTCDREVTMPLLHIPYPGWFYFYGILALLGLPMLFMWRKSAQRRPVPKPSVIPNVPSTGDVFEKKDFDFNIPEPNKHVAWRVDHEVARRALDNFYTALLEHRFRWESEFMNQLESINKDLSKQEFNFLTDYELNVGFNKEREELAAAIKSARKPGGTPKERTQRKKTALNGLKKYGYLIKGTAGEEFIQKVEHTIEIADRSCHLFNSHAAADINDCIEKDQLPEACYLLKKMILDQGKEDELLNNLLQYQNRYNTLLKERELMSAEEFSIRRNKICKALMDLLDETTRNTKQSELPEG